MLTKSSNRMEYIYDTIFIDIINFPIIAHIAI